MKTKLISIVMVVLLVAALGINAFAESNIGVQPGQTMPDFTVSLTDGTTATLSDLLKEKDLVVLNIFASWCGPCEREFPEMEEVYQANSENMVIVSVSGDPNDTMETISAYKANHNLTFPMGLAGDGLSFLSVPGFPTTLFIDRNGNVGFIKVGAFVDKGEFEGKVSTFLSPDYDGKPLASEEAVSFTPYFMGASVLGILLLIVGREFMVSALRLVVANKGTVVPASFAGKAKTAFTMAAIVAALLWQTFLFDFQLFGMQDTARLERIMDIVLAALFWIAAALTVWSGWEYLKAYWKDINPNQ